MAYVMTAVDLDGTNDNLHLADVPGDFTQDDGWWFVLNFYIRALPTAGEWIRIWSHERTSGTGSNRRGDHFEIDENGTLEIRKAAPYTAGFLFQGTIAGFTAGQWYQVVGSTKRNDAAACHAYVNGQAATLIVDYALDAAYGLTRQATRLGRRVAYDGMYWNGYLGDVIIGEGFHDFRIPANLAKVWEAGGGLIGGCPVDPGADGSLITGSEPVYCFRGNGAAPDDPDQYNNKTSRGPFTKYGLFELAPSSPSDGCGVAPALPVGPVTARGTTAPVDAQIGGLVVPAGPVTARGTTAPVVPTPGEVIVSTGAATAQGTTAPVKILAGDSYPVLPVAARGTTGSVTVSAGPVVKPLLATVSVDAPAPLVATAGPFGRPAGPTTARGTTAPVTVYTGDFVQVGAIAARGTTAQVLPLPGGITLPVGPTLARGTVGATVPLGGPSARLLGAIASRDVIAPITSSARPPLANYSYVDGYFSLEHEVKGYFSNL